MRTPRRLRALPLRYHAGTRNRPIQEEYYRWWMMFGVELNF